MNLLKETTRIKQIINFLMEYVDIPTDSKTSDETQYKTIIGGPPIKIEKEKEPYFKPNKEYGNQFAGTFGNDVLSIKEFIQKIFPNSNLNFIGAGAFGFAMSPKGHLNLPSNFTQNNFFGILQPENSTVILKFTTNKHEADKIKEIIQKQNGIHPGIVNYYWVKEIDLPNNLSFSSVLGVPRNEPLNREQKKELFIKMRSPDYWNTPEDQRKDFNLNKKDRQKYERDFQNFIKRFQKLNSSKRDKVYVICLDKVQKLSKEEKNNVWFCFQYFWESDWYTKNISVIRSIYLNDRRLKDFWLKKIREKTKTSVNIPEFETFKQTLYKLLNSIEKFGVGYNKFDLHDGNVGIKNGEYVFFDVFA